MTTSTSSTEHPWILISSTFFLSRPSKSKDGRTGLPSVECNRAPLDATAKIAKRGDKRGTSGTPAPKAPCIQARLGRLWNGGVRMSVLKLCDGSRATSMESHICRCHWRGRGRGGFPFGIIHLCAQIWSSFASQAPDVNMLELDLSCGVLFLVWTTKLNTLRRARPLRFSYHPSISVGMRRGAIN
jgi:hypothetical protein